VIEHATRFEQRLAAIERVGIELASASQVGAGNTRVLFEKLEEAADTGRPNGAGVAV
jgi:hypothetical protein